MPYAFNDVEGAPREQLSRAALENLQCNVLRPAGRYYSRQAFVRFEEGAALRTWLSNLSATSHTRGGDDANISTLLFTKRGLVKLGVPAALLDKMDPAFFRGARNDDTLKKLRDPSPQNWGDHGLGWDAAHLTFSYDAPAPAALPPSCVAELGNALDRNGRVVTDATEGDGRFGHFGHRDGISNPVFEPSVPEQKYERWDPRRPLSTLVVKDPLAAGGVESAFGSYFVFRKYRQNVAEFEKRVADIRDEILKRRDDGHVPSFEGRFPDFAGLEGDALVAKIKAWIVGRDLEGRLVSQNGNGAVSNDFDYSDDPSGAVCPFSGHARKMAPRLATADAVAIRRQTLARRGVPYGTVDTPDNVGLLFWCAQADIENQFEFSQQRFANNDQEGSNLEFPPSPDLDSLIGRIDPGPAFENVTDAYPATSRWWRWKSTIDVPFEVWKTVTLCGSEYFFAPSLAGIERLKEGNFK
ncbi:MAG TPA: hypothetical protein VG937_10615 [Polyangiaceae bacterium]|nr:hypothetical protein [Polyangiaceae bacterium]